MFWELNVQTEFNDLKIRIIQSFKNKNVQIYMI